MAMTLSAPLTMMNVLAPRDAFVALALLSLPFPRIFYFMQHPSLAWSWCMCASVPDVCTWHWLMQEEYSCWCWWCHYAKTLCYKEKMSFGFKIYFFFFPFCFAQITFVLLYLKFTLLKAFSNFNFTSLFSWMLLICGFVINMVILALRFFT